MRAHKLCISGYRADAICSSQVRKIQYKTRFLVACVGILSIWENGESTARAREDGDVLRRDRVVLHRREHAVDKPGAFVHVLCELHFAPLVDLEVYELETAIITRNIRARRICLCSIRGPREWWSTGFWRLSTDEHHHAPRPRTTCLSYCFHIFNAALALMLTLHATNERRRSCTHTRREQRVIGNILGPIGYIACVRRTTRPEALNLQVAKQR